MCLTVDCFVRQVDFGADAFKPPKLQVHSLPGICFPTQHCLGEYLRGPLLEQFIEIELVSFLNSF